MYKKGQQLETALEARRFMVAYPGCSVEGSNGGSYQWNNHACNFEYLNRRARFWCRVPEYEIFHRDEALTPFTIIDEPEQAERLDPQTGEVRPVVMANNTHTTPKQPEWVCLKASYHQAIDALQHICKHAQQVRGNAPEWSALQGFHSYLPLTETQEMRLKYVLQIGATVEYLPKEGQYVVGNVHTNTIEGFWSQLKRSINGTYHSVAPKYLQNYVDEFAYRYNLRNSGEHLFHHLVPQAAQPV